MNSYSQHQIPIINLSNISIHSDRGTQEWNHLCKTIREASEKFGCFEVIYDKLSVQLRNHTFSMAKQVFDLPAEIKKKNTNPKPVHGYLGDLARFPLYESLSIEDASNYDSLASFAELLWPNGHHQFCGIFNSMMKAVEELKKTIEMMILDSYGLGEKFESTLENKTFLRMMKYGAPPAGEWMNGLSVHTDKGYFVLLFEDQVSGLQVETKDGNWIQLCPSSPCSFFFQAGDSLKAWSNGRVHSPKHTVIMKGDKDRYSFGAFALPIDGKTIKPVKELVDENHPQLFKEFDYAEFINFCFVHDGKAIESANQLFAYAATN